MKGGILYSNFVTTVSPNYADEALYDDGACGLGRTLKEQQDKFRGILNGVDYDAWSHETDPYLPDRYSGDSLADKNENKNALRDRFWLREADGPVVAYVGRLDEQKGMHLVDHALFYTLARGGQFILIGDAHYHDGITGHFWHQRLTAVANVPLTIAAIVIIMSILGRNHAAVVQILGSPLVAIIMLLFIVASVWHMKIGMQVVIEDYVQSEMVKLAAIMANNFFSVAVALASIYAILKLSSGV